MLILPIIRFNSSLPADLGWTPSLVTANVTWTESSSTAASVAVATQGRHALLKDGAADATQDILVKIRTPSMPASLFGGGVIARASGGVGTENGIIFTFNNSGYVGVQAGTYTNGVYDPQTAVEYAWSLNTDYWMRLRVNGTTVNARIWPATDAEPGTWNITTTTPLVASGGLGLFAFSQPHTYSDFAYALAGSTVASPVPAITAVDQAANVIYQVDGASSAVAMSGAYGGDAPASIEAQLYESDGTTIAQAWTPLTDATISAGSWSGSLAAVGGGMYRFRIRSKNVSDVVLSTSALSTNLWGVGHVIALIGSSSSERWAGASSGTYAADPAVRRYYSGGWSASTAGGIVNLANQLIAATGFPVAYVECGLGGTTLSQWSNPANSTYLEALTRINAVGGKLSGVMVTVGSNDAGTLASKAAHLASYQALVSNMRTALGQPSLPFFVWGSNRRPGSAFDVDFARIREAEKDMGLYANTRFAVQTADLEVDTDNVHMTTAGFQAGMGRMIPHVLEVLGGAAAAAALPAISAITYSGSTVTVTLTHSGGTDFTPVSAITGFSGTDDNGALTFSAAVRASATTITLTTSAPIVGIPTIRYLYGADPIASGGGVKDNHALALPLAIETEMVATAAGSSPAWVQVTPALAVTGTTGVLDLPVDSTDGSCVGCLISLFDYNGTISSVVGNLVGGGTVPLTLRATYPGTAVANSNGYLYTADSAAPITSITAVVSGGFGWRAAMAFEASTAVYDAPGQAFTPGSAGVHAATVNTTASNDLIAALVYPLTAGAITPSAGYQQEGVITSSHFVLRSNAATGAAGAKSIGYTPAASETSEIFAFALRGA